MSQVPPKRVQLIPKTPSNANQLKNQTPSSSQRASKASTTTVRSVRLPPKKSFDRPVDSEGNEQLKNRSSKARPSTSRGRKSMKRSTDSRLIESNKRKSKTIVLPKGKSSRNKLSKRRNRLFEQSKTEITEPLKINPKQFNKMSTIIPGKTQSSDENIETKWKIWFNNDFIVIFALWSVEAVTHIFAAWKNMLLDGFVYDPSGVVNNVQPSIIFRAILTIVACVITLLTCYLLQNRPHKLWAIIAALTFHGLAALLCLFITNFRHIVLSMTVKILAIGWHVANPLRFFLIFHQRFPINVFHSRVLTSFNLAIIGTASYLSTVLITQSYGFHKAAYFWAFFLLTVIMIGCLVLSLFSKHQVLEEPTDLREIYYEYQAIETESHFLFRNKLLTTVLVTIILLTRVIFTVITYSTSLFMFQQENFTFFRYRIDLLAGLIAMSSVQLMVHPLKRPKDETKDLFIIGIAHYLNLVALFVLMSQPVPQAPMEIVDDGTNRFVIVMFHPPEWSGRFNVDPGTNDAIITGEMYEEHLATVVANVKNGSEIVLTGWLKNSPDDIPTLVFNYRISPRKSKLFFYCHDDTLIPIDWTLTDFEPSIASWAVINFVKPCSSDLSNLAYNGKCRPVQFKLEQFSDDKYVSSVKSETVQPPKQFHPSPYFEMKENSFISTYLTDDGKSITKPINGLLEQGTITVFFITNTKNDKYLRLGTKTWRENETIPVPTSQSTSKYPIPWRSLPHLKWSTAVSTTLVAVGDGFARTSYIHFAWINCPFERRVLILGAYFTVDYLVKSVVPLTFNKITSNTSVALLCVQIVFVILHIILTLSFSRIVPPLNISDQIGGRMF